MADTPLVSVLTPIYNVEKYLPQCLDSLIAQTMQNIEFICINDGSTDNSLAILEEYAAKDSRFVIVDKPNSGYGASMNRGLAIAKGEYIGIVESDDFAEPDMFEALYQMAKKQDADVCKSNYYQFNDLSGSSFVKNYKDEFIGVVFRPRDAKWQKVFHTTPCIWSAIYKRSFLISNNIDFNETPGASFQDTAFVLKAWIAAERAVIVPEGYLHYRVDRPESSVRSSSKPFCVCDEYASVEGWLAERPAFRAAIIKRLNACKVGTYIWNARRLDDSVRDEFIQRAHEELTLAYRSDEIEFSMLSKERQRFVHRLIENPEQTKADERARSSISRPVKVSVIVATFNNGNYLDETLASLSGQTLQDIEIIVVNDGSTDNTQAIIHRRQQLDPRIIHVYQENAGVGSARNRALDMATGECIAFCDGDDIVPPKAYEKLYSAIALNRADMSIGSMLEFSLVHKTEYPQTKIHSQAQEISKFDLNFNWALSLCNKMFRRSVIESLELRFDDRIMGEDSVFMARYLSACSSIVGANEKVYQYRKLLFFQRGLSATGHIDLETIESHCRSFEDLLEIRSKCFDDAIESCNDQMSADVETLKAQKTLCLDDLQLRYCTLLIDRYFKSLWNLDSAAYDFLRARYEEGRRRLSHLALKSVQKVDTSLDLGDDAKLPDIEHILDHPLISVIVSNQTNPSLVGKLIQSLYRQDFVSFEVVVPDSLELHVPRDLLARRNLRIIEGKQGSYLEEALKQVKSPYVNVLEDEILHCRSSLRMMWERACASRADFVGFNVYGVSNNATVKLRTLREAYRKKYTSSPTMRIAINALDCSPNNKVYKRDALLDRRILPIAEQDMHKGVQKAYDVLSFEKVGTRYMVCMHDDRWFLGHAGAEVRASMEISNVGRYLQSDAFAKALQRQQELAFKVARKAKSVVLPVKRQVLFTTNRADDLPPNCKAVYEALGDDVERIVMCKRLPHARSYDRNLMRVIEESSIIITDDYCHVLPKMKIRPQQKIIQLWHAAGAFKKFGLDYCGADIAHEKSLHKNYHAVMVSSEYVRPIYAGAFGIPVENVLALGVPRTDAFFDDREAELRKNLFFERHSELRDKKLVTYCPTFRQKAGRQVIWDPRIDWRAFSEGLPEDVTVIVKKHPLETRNLVIGEFENIIEADGIDATTLCLVSSLMITDYSSIVFDCCILGVPTLFYCPDYQEYESDYYSDFPGSFPGQFVEKSDELPTAIKNALAGDSLQANEVFKEKYVGACDGHSTERIAAYIHQLLQS